MQCYFENYFSSLYGYHDPEVRLPLPLLSLIAIGYALLGMIFPFPGLPILLHDVDPDRSYIREGITVSQELICFEDHLMLRCYLPIQEADRAIGRGGFLSHVNDLPHLPDRTSIRRGIRWVQGEAIIYACGLR